MERIKKQLILLLLLMGTGISSGAQNRYIVHFTDKAASPFSIQSPEQFLSPRAIGRRERQHIAVSQDDFPVNPSYVQQLKLTGVSVYFTSRWMNCALVEANASDLPALSNLPFVEQVNLVAPGIKSSGGRTRKIRSRSESGIAAATRSQLEMVGIGAMHAEEVKGDGVLIALFDSGYQGVNTAMPFSHLFDSSRLKDTYDFVGRGADVYRYDYHGTEVLSVIAANSSTFTGGAYEASFQLYVTEDVTGEYRIEEYNWLFAAERADSSGVDIISSSLGYNLFDDPSMNYSLGQIDGKSAVVSIAASEALKRGMIVVCSAGNEGSNSWGIVTPPADVNGILAVGSVNIAGIRSFGSSHGPTSDGRIKPDVMAMGVSTQVIDRNGEPDQASGTSLAAPIIASLVIGILQKFPDLRVQEVYQAIISSASLSDSPNNLMGYGIPNYSLALDVLAEPISVFPNPLNEGKFKVFLRTANQDVDITIYDLHGRRLSDRTVHIAVTNNPVEVNLSDLPAGIYLVRLRTKDNFKAVRVIKL